MNKRILSIVSILSVLSLLLAACTNYNKVVTPKAPTADDKPEFFDNGFLFLFMNRNLIHEDLKDSLSLEQNQFAIWREYGPVSDAKYRLYVGPGKFPVPQSEAVIYYLDVFQHRTEEGYNDPAKCAQPSMPSGAPGQPGAANPHDTCSERVSNVIFANAVSGGYDVTTQYQMVPPATLDPELQKKLKDLYLIGGHDRLVIDMSQAIRGERSEMSDIDPNIADTILGEGKIATKVNASLNAMFSQLCSGWDCAKQVRLEVRGVILDPAFFAERASYAAQIRAAQNQLAIVDAQTVAAEKQNELNLILQGYQAELAKRSAADFAEAVTSYINGLPEDQRSEAWRYTWYWMTQFGDIQPSLMTEDGLTSPIIPTALP